jgi:hypothetical protein
LEIPASEPRFATKSSTLQAVAPIDVVLHHDGVEVLVGAALVSLKYAELLGQVNIVVGQRNIPFVPAWIHQELHRLTVFTKDRRIFSTSVDVNVY